jgi:hypothetical protein
VASFVRVAADKNLEWDFIRAKKIQRMDSVVIAPKK